MNELPYKKGNRRDLKTDSLPHNIGNPNKTRLPVTKQSKKEYINEMRQRYHAATKQEQTKLLDEIVKVCSFNRKYLIRMLNKKPSPKYPLALYGETKKKAGRPKEYHAAEILAFLLRVWHASNQACSKRLKSILYLWLPKYEEATGVVLSLEHQVLILRMSLLTTIPKTLNCNAPGKSICNPYRGITKEGSITNNHEQKNNSGILQNQSLPCPPLRLPFIMRQHARGAGRCELSAHPR